MLMKTVAACLLLAVITSTAPADVTLPSIFSDHAILQRDMPIPVWGTAEVGEQVTVTLGEQSKTATADNKGQWSVKLDPLPVGDPCTMKVVGNNMIEINDILIGEVWLCSGQSNMAMNVSRAANADEETANAKTPCIRQFTIRGGWVVCSPETAGRFSATAYFFGRRLHEELDVPVALLNSSVGGTPIESWTGPENAGNLYQSLIAPLAPYALRGAIWYQGERNSKQGDPSTYAQKLPALIRGWRSAWDQGDFPFYYVQLPDFQAPRTQPSETNGWVLVREGMLKTLALSNTGMAVTLGAGDARDIHPKDKQTVGTRLALWALANAYEQDVVCSGPIFKAAATKNNKMIITFDHIGGGLVAKDGPKLKGFAIAGADKQFVWADAVIEGDTVVVSSPNVKTPEAVRYAWAANPEWNLTNKADLPASPFRTDDWQPE